MAQITDYASLQTAIGLFAKRADVSANVDLLIQLAEAQLLADLKLGGNEVVTTALVTSPGSDLVVLPADYDGMRALVMTSPSFPLKPRTPNQLYSGWAAAASGPPQEYSILGRGGPLGQYQLQIRPIPLSAYILRMVYNARLPALSSVSTNWLLTAYPTIYLYGALRQAMAFGITDDRIGLWDQAYTNVLRQIMNKDEELLYPNGLTMEIVDESTQSEDGFFVQTPDYVSMVVSGVLNTGDLVNIFDAGGGVPNCRQASAAAGTPRPCHGYVSAAFTAGQTATVFFEGNNSNQSGLTIGTAYLSDTTPGRCISAAPVGVGKVSQPVGVATSTTNLNFEAGNSVIL